MAWRDMENLTIADKVQWIPICRRVARNGFTLQYVSFCCIGKITLPRIIAEVYKVAGFAFVAFCACPECYLHASSSAINLIVSAKYNN